MTSAQILRELGHLPVTSAQQAQQVLEKGVAFLPLTALCPGLHNLLSLRARMGVRNSAHNLVKLLNPFRGEAVLVAPATHPDFITLMRDILVERGQRPAAAWHRGRTGGQREATAAAQLRPQRRRRSAVRGRARQPARPAQPARGLRCREHRAVGRGGYAEKQVPLPKPVANQLACLLFASGSR